MSEIPSEDSSRKRCPFMNGSDCLGKDCGLWVWEWLDEDSMCSGPAIVGALRGIEDMIRRAE